MTVQRWMFVGVLLMCPALVQAQSPPSLEDQVTSLALPVFGGLALADAVMTVSCVEQHVCHEANPLIAPFVNQHGIRAAMAGKLAVNAGMIGTLLWVRHQYPEHTRLVMVATLSLVGVQGYVVAQNAITLNRGRPK